MFLCTITGINYTLSVDAQSVQRGVPSRVRLVNETSDPPRGTFNGTLELMIDSESCIQTTAIFQVYKYVCVLLKQMGDYKYFPQN